MTNSRFPTLSTVGLAALVALVGGLGSVVPAVQAAGVQAQVFVSPSGSDSNPGTQSQPIQSVARAQQLVRSMNSSMSGDIQVVLEDGFYRLSSPLSLTPADSGSNGFNVVWTAAPGSQPVLAGSDQITGWSLFDSARNIWMAQAPTGIKTRQLY